MGSCGGLWVVVSSLWLAVGGILCLWVYSFLVWVFR